MVFNLKQKPLLYFSSVLNMLSERCVTSQYSYIFASIITIIILVLFSLQINDYLHYFDTNYINQSHDVNYHNISNRNSTFRVHNKQKNDAIISNMDQQEDQDKGIEEQEDKEKDNGIAPPIHGGKDIPIMSAIESNRSNKHLLNTLNNLKINNKSESDIKFFKNKSIIIGGMVHNAQNIIDKTMKIIERITKMFNNSIVIIFESNSNDNTLKILNKWTNKISNIYIFHGDRKIIKTEINELKYLLQKHKLSRIERFHIYRNFILNKTKELIMINNNINWDYLLLYDFDICDVNLWSIFNELHFCKSDIMCVNGIRGDPNIPYHRDIFAAIKSNGFWLYDYTMFGHSDLWNELNGFPINRYESMYSCFGGMAFYKIKNMSIFNCKYKMVIRKDDYLKNMKLSSSTFLGSKWIIDPINFSPKLLYIWQTWNNYTNGIYKEPICEHIGFNECLNNIGYNISLARDAFIFPKNNMKQYFD